MSTPHHHNTSHENSETPQYVTINGIDYDEESYAQMAIANAKEISAALGPIDPQETVRMIREDRDAR